VSRVSDPDKVQSHPVIWPKAAPGVPHTRSLARRKDVALPLEADSSTQPLPRQYVERQRAAAEEEDEDMSADEVVEKGMEAAETTAHELGRIHTLPHRLDRDVRQYGMKHFMPGWKFNDSIFVFTLILCFLSTVIVFVYFCFIYVDDRSESLQRWESVLDDTPELLEGYPLTPGQNRRGEHPDIIIVFHHPDHESSEKDSGTKIQPKGMDHIIVDDHDKDLFSELEGMRRDAKKGVDTTRGVLRQALLRDMDAVMPHWGFDVAPFSSIDEDEIFLAVSLRKHSTLSYYLSKQQPFLQVRQDLAEKLDVDQDPDDPCSSPAFLPYSTSTLQQLKAQRVIVSSEEISLWKNYRLAGQETILSSKECIRTIFTELVSHVDLFAAEEHGLIVMWYAAHDPGELAILRAIWANWGNMTDFSFVQPVSLLKEYFGARIAFLFAWNGVYCKAMLPICVISMIQVVVVIIGKLSGHQLVHQRQVVGFSIVLTVWSRLAANLWEREQHFLMELWGLGSFDEEGIIRPQFNGTLEKSPIDGKLTEKQDNHKKSMLRHAVATCATVFFCIVVGCFLFSWMIMFKGHTNVLSSIMLSLQIKIFQFSFRWCARALTEFENHKFQDNYHNSLIWKLFTFEFVNNYSVFIFLTIKDSWQPDELKGAALFKTQRQITSTLLVLSVMSIVQVPVQNAITRFWLWKEHFDMKRMNGGVEPPPRSFAEEQSKYKRMDDSEEVQCTMNLVIALGFVLLFGGVSAWVVPFCFAVFAVQVRALAVMLTTNTQRTFPYRCRGMGYWCGVVNFLNVVGLGYSGFLFVAYGKSFQGATLLSKVTGFCLFCAGMGLLWVFVDMAFPPQDPGTHLLARRRQHVLRKIQERATTQELANHPETTHRIQRGLTRSGSRLPAGIRSQSARSGSGSPTASAASPSKVS
jgi:hypothetical protein